MSNRQHKGGGADGERDEMGCMTVRECNSQGFFVVASKGSLG